MYRVVAIFTENDEPATGLSPVVKVRDLDSGVIVNNEAMSEAGEGFYYYDFSMYDYNKDYTIVCDAVTLSGSERYTYGTSGEYGEKLDIIDTTVSGVSSTVSTVDLRTALIRKVQTNKLVLIDGTTDNWILYDDDDSTPLLTFSVTDKNGNIVVQAENIPSRRTKADGDLI